MFADGITSANVVGYQTSALLPNTYTMFGIQFQGTDGNGVKFKDLSGNFYGGDGLGSADNILVWLPDSGYHYYYYGVFNNSDFPEWDNIWYNDSTNLDASEETIDAGTACWYLRMSDAEANLTISGQVKLTPTTTTILANNYTMFSNPYPTALKFKNINVASPNGGDGLASADNIIVWLSDGYHYYYYGVFNNSDFPEWDNIWYNDSTNLDASEEEIPAGSACWYLRIGDATTMSFSSPLAE